MGMYAAASVCLAIGAAATWSKLLFDLFWLLGAVLTVPYLAAGEMLLLWRSGGSKRVAQGTVVAFVLALTVVATTAIFSGAPADASVLAEDLPRGAAVYAREPTSLALARVCAYGAFAILVAGAGYSAWKMRGRAELRGRFVGTLLIVLGATIVAGGSAFAATGLLIGFSLTLLAGICVMFAGFLVASSPK